MNILDASAGLLKGIQELLQKIYIPMIRAMESGWGALAGPDGLDARMEFLNHLESFVHILEVKKIRQTV
jgi:hypothetical protein